MLKFGERIDPKIHVKLFEDVITNSEKLPKSNLQIDLAKVSFGLSKDKSEPLFSNDKDYTFRKYGEMKNFTLDNQGELVTTKSHLEYIKNSPKLSINYVDEEVLAGRVYGISFVYFNFSIKEAVLRLIRLDSIDNLAYLCRYMKSESVSYIERVLDMIAEADVIALHVNVNNKAHYDIILLVDDQTKIFLDKLITIYRMDGRMREYLAEHKITLGMVLDNLDLYHCISFGV